MKWFGVRSVYRFEGWEGARNTFEERVVLFEAEDEDAAIAKAEAEAAEYVGLLGHGEVVPFFQSYWMADDPVDGGEVFSLMRDSDMEPETYLDHFFDTGEEHQRSAE